MKFIPHTKPSIGKEEIEAVFRILKSGRISDGNEVLKIEKKIAHLSGKKYAASVNSGSAALHLALLSLNIKKDDEVIMPAYVCQALLNAVNYVQAKPVLVDVRIEDGNIDPEKIKAAITKKTKVVIVPHMYGKMADMEVIVKLGVPVIEDCAMALSAKLKSKIAGSFGAVSVFSFFASKLVTSGEGGAIATNDKRISEMIKELREYDVKMPYKVRYNYKLNNINAAIVFEQIKKLPKFIKRRREIALNYEEGLKDLPLILPVQNKRADDVFAKYVIRSKQADGLRSYLKKHGIGCGFGVQISLHELLGIKQGFPNADILMKTSVSLPIYPGLSDRDQTRIIKEIIMFYKSYGRK